MKIKTLFIALAIGMTLMFSQTAHAKGLMIINTGDELFTVADFPNTIVSEFPDLKALSVGYKCNRFGLFWADVWTWNCTMVGVDDSGYADLPEKVVSQLAGDKNFAMGKAQRSFWNHYGMLVCLAALAAITFFGRNSSD